MRVPLIVAGLPLRKRGVLFHEFAYITDIASTLLNLAGQIPPPKQEGMEIMSGKRLLPLIDTGVSPLRSAKEAIGYEFSGNAALFQGAFKLSRNLPPAGSGQWHLFNLRDDPGETSDLSEVLPDQFRDMLAEYTAYAERVGVLPMPENYSLTKQVAINALLFVYLPRYLPLFLLLACVASYVLLRRRRTRVTEPR